MTEVQSSEVPFLLKAVGAALLAGAVAVDVHNSGSFIALYIVTAGAAGYLLARLSRA